MVTDKRCSSAVHRTERTRKSFTIQKHRQFILKVILRSLHFPCETFVHIRMKDGKTRLASQHHRNGYSNQNGNNTVMTREHALLSDVYWTVHHCDNWRIKNQLDVTYYFIVLLIGSTCFGHYYAHHQELTTMKLITTLVVFFLVCFSLQPGHYSSPTTPNLQHTANQEQNDQCGNEHHSRELLMMGIVMPETCWAYKKYNKIISGV